MRFPVSPVVAHGEEHATLDDRDEAHGVGPVSRYKLACFPGLFNYSGGTVKLRPQTLGWLALLSGVIIIFFHETIFRGCSLVPTDVLNQLTAPYDAGVQDAHVRNHYTFDILRADYPYAKFWQEDARRAEVPLWNPQILGGFPLMADSQYGVLSPFKILYLFLSSERGFSLGIVLEMWLAGVLMFAFLRELGRSGPAAFVGAVAYALSSQFLMWYWRLPSTFAWAPLILLLVERSVRRTSWGYAAGAGVVLGLAMICGNIQASSHLGFLCVGYLAGTVFAANPDGRANRVARAGIVLMVGILVSAVQLLPTLEVLVTGITRDLHAAGSGATVRHTLLGIPFLLTFMFPGLAGSTESYSLTRAFGADMADFNGYIGIVPCMLFVVGAFVVRERPVRWLLLTSGGVLVIIFFTPLLRLVYHRFLIVVVFSECVIAAYGMDALLEMRAANSRAVRRTMIGMLVIGVMVTIGLLTAQWIVAANWNRLLEAGQKYILSHEGGSAFHNRQWELDRVELFLRHYRITNVVFWLPLTFLVIVVAGWQAYVRGWLSRNTFAAALLLSTVTDLTVLGRNVVPQIDLRQFPLYPPLETIKTVQADHGLFRVQPQPWAPGADRFFLAWGILTAYHLSVIDGAVSLEPEDLLLLPYQHDGQWTPVADLLNIKYVLVPDDVTLPANHFSLLKNAQGVRLYLNDRCLPRMQFFPVWKVVPDRKQILAAMSAPTFEPRRTVFIETEPPELFRSQLSSSAMSQDAAGKVEVEEYTPRRVRGRVHCSVPGVVLLADTFYPGWYATVDGAPTPIYRADYVMRAVFVTAGDHEIEFRYVPLSFRLGATISCITLAGVALMGLWLGMRRRIVRGLA